MVFKIAMMVLGINYGVHVGTALAYGKFCVPESVWGIAQSLISTASPMCSMLLNTMISTQSNYALVLTTTLATSLASLLKA